MKIIVVEDDINTLDSITNMLINIDNNFCIEIASNGIDGLNTIKQFQPDFIITDICMPKMDGLQMLSELKNEGYNFFCIIISTYPEFEFVRRALGLGVSDYLLKPVSMIDLANAIEKIRTKIINYRKNLLTNCIKQYISNGAGIDFDAFHFFNDNFNNYKNNTHIIEIYLGEYYNLFYQKCLTLINEICKNYSYLQCINICIEEYKCIFLVIYSTDNTISIDKWLKNGLLNIINNDLQYHICIGYNDCKKLSNNNLFSAIKELHENMDWNIVYKDNKIIIYDQVKSIKTNPLIYPIKLVANINDALCKENYNELKMYIKRLFILFYNNIYSPKQIKEVCTRLIYNIIEVYEKIYPDKIEFLKFQIFIDNINNAISFSELCNCFSRFFQYIIPDDQQSQNKLISLTVLRAKNFIHEYYFKHITLEEIARYLKVTPEYLGTQFKKELGINFSTYLKNYRIQKAKELLITTDLKFYEISKKVGYNDIKYFSRIFKEVTGKTSADFRNR